MNKAVNVIIAVYTALFFLASLLIFAFSLATRIYFRQNEQNDLYVIGREHILLLLISLVIALFLFSLASRKLAVRAKEPAADAVRISTGLCGILGMAVSAAMSLWLIWISRSLPVNDGKTLNGIINAFMEGDFSSLNTGGYLNQYPFQIGYVAAGQLLYLIFGKDCYYAYQILNVISILALYYCLYQSAWLLFGSRKICEETAFFYPFLLNLWLYSTFIYNDIWSLGPQAAAIMLTLRFLKDGKVRHMISGSIWIAAACLLKTNCYIAAVAMALILLVDAVRRKNGKKTLERVGIIILMLVMIRVPQKLMQEAYTKAAGLESWPDGITAPCYFAMGMDEMEGKYGWYDGLNVSLYSQNGCDSEKASAAAWEVVQEKMQNFSANKKYFVKFYLIKFLSQWGDPTNASMREYEERERHIDNLSPVVTDLIFGTGNKIVQWIMNVMHSLIWLGTAAAILHLWKKKKYTDGQAFVIMYVFGGMVFHEMWEASSRYVLRYVLMLLPFAAYGLSVLTEKVLDIAKRSRTKQKGRAV